jgi:hypothetical protein
MKPYIATVFLGLGVCHSAWAKPAELWQNDGVVTVSPVVDAVGFYNAGDIEIETVTGYSATNVNNIYGNGYSVLPFSTKDTLYFTNTSSGTMIGEPGFRFDTITSTSRHNASRFLNQGTILGVDTEATLVTFSTPGGTTFVAVDTESQPIPSQIMVHATNIVNQGTMAVGNYGLLQLEGRNVTNSYASLQAGGVNSAGVITGGTNLQQVYAAEIDTTSRQENWVIAGSTTYFYLNPPYVYDVFWGISNTLTLELDSLAPPTVPGINVGVRGYTGSGTVSFPLNLNAQSFAAYVYSNAIPTPTNVYYDIVFVNTNFADANLSAQVGFTQLPETQVLNYLPPNDANGTGVIVQFSEPVYDVITGDTVTNAVYLMDGGASLGTMTLSRNAGNADSTFRPNAFEVTTGTPSEWLAALPANIPYDRSLIYTNAPGVEGDQNGAFNTKVAYTVGEYGVQIGRNPEEMTGVFSTGTATNTLSLLESGVVNLPDPTNEPGRIEITAENLELTKTRLRAEGMVVLNVTNLVGGGSSSSDWGLINSSLGATNGKLVISNLYPTTFQRVRGDIYAWTASWQNVFTNASVTNNVHVHLLVVDQNLRGTFQSTIRDLKLSGKKSISVQDNLYVVNSDLFETTNLTLNGTVRFTQNAADFTSKNMPETKNFFVISNGYVTADSSLVVGYDLAKGQTAPGKRKYSIETVTNFGTLISTAPLFETPIFENDGIIYADNGGSLVVEANAIGLGLALTNSTNLLGNFTNYLAADGNVTLSAETIRATNSIIYAGMGEEGTLTLDAPERLTDFVPGLPSTNSALTDVNFWQVTGGFSLPVKPLTGDLFGTEIETIATGFNIANHVWAGTDLGSNVAGFVNNVVIGHLKLSLQSANAALHFSGAGTKNGMYVDYLELDLTSQFGNDYRDGLVIDPNLTIYFADANVDPLKLEDAYPNRLVWVPTFAGPNSTVAVPYKNSTNVCLMNAALANSQDIAFFPGAQPNYYNRPYVLNDPNNPTNIYPCPGEESTARAFLISRSGTNATIATISVNGKGSISPALQPGQLALGNSYTLTATAAKGWVFRGWETSGLSGSENVHSNVLSFTLQANTTIVADFVTNPFVSLKGVYNGLFYDPNEINPGSSGYVTLALGKNGAYSGRLFLGPESYGFSSKFDGSGGGQAVAKHGSKMLGVSLQLDTTGGTDRITGQVGKLGWNAQLWADLGLTWTAKKPSPLAGRYTASLPWTNVDGLSAGDSYATATVNKLGLLSAIGGLADGATFSQSAPVSKYGQWPFYAYIGSGKDLILGWVAVSSNGLSSTNVVWTKGTNNGRYYNEGFTNVLQLIGSPYQAPSNNAPALELTNPVVVLSGADLPQTLTNAVTLGQNQMSYTSSGVTLNIKAAVGSFNGRLFNTSTGKIEKMSGVVLQNTNSARGFFLGTGTNESGGVLLRGN